MIDPIFMHKLPDLKDRKCATCTGLYNKDLRGTKGTCSAQGITDDTRACSSFQLDHSIIAGQGTLLMSTNILEAIRGASPAVLQYLPQLLAAEQRIRNLTGRNILCKIYFRWQGRGHYLSNYAVGYIVDADRSHVTLVGATGKVVYTMLLTEFRKTGFDEERWAPIKARMMAEGRLHDSSLPVKARKLYETEIELPAFDELGDESSEKMRKALQRADVSEIIRDVHETGTVSRTYDRIVKPKDRARLKFSFDDPNANAKASEEPEEEAEEGEELEAVDAE